MKKGIYLLMTMLLLVLSTTIVQSQHIVTTSQGGDLCIYRCDNAGIQYAWYNYDLTIMDDQHGISVTVKLDPPDNKNQTNFDCLYIYTIGFKECSNNYNVIFTFEDCTTLELSGQGGPNELCNFYCGRDDEYFREMVKEKIISITVINLKDLEVITIPVPVDQQKYFQEAYQVLKTSLKPLNCLVVKQ